MSCVGARKIEMFVERRNRGTHPLGDGKEREEKEEKNSTE